MKSVEQYIFLNAQFIPQKIALIKGDECVPYQQLTDQCYKVANLLREKYSIQEGDRIILFVINDIPFIYLYFAIHLLGGVCVPIDADVTPNRFEYIRQSIKPKLIVGNATNLSCETLSYDDCLLGRSDVIEELHEININAPADILYTTGTTGNPKGVILTHKNLAATVRNINEFIGNQSTDVELLALPLSHSFGLGRMRCALVKGETVVLVNSFANVKLFFHEMQRCSVTGFAMVPAVWSYFKRMSGTYIAKYADQLRYIEIGSAFMSIDDKKQLMELLPHTRICMHYGMTEASRSAFMEFHENSSNLSTIGKASPNVDIKIIDGEICIKGEHVCQAYWGEYEDHYRYDCIDGYFRSGDSGYSDEQGNFYLNGRLKEIINVGGEKVSPIEVEDAVISLGVGDCVCVPMKDTTGVLGEVVKCYILRNATELSFDEISARLIPILEAYKRPVLYEWIDNIPMTQSGKKQRVKLISI